MAYTLAEIKDQLIATGHRLDRKGWAPATSGNYSHRLDHDSFVVTASGYHKGALTRDAIMLVDYDGQPLEAKKPSAETLLHCSLYELFPKANAILHTHSINSTVLTMLGGSHLAFEGYELQKAYPGIDTHESKVVLPIFDNCQDMEVLAPAAKAYLQNHPSTPAYLIRGHGIYAWGSDMAEAERIIEATEFLLACEIESRKISRKQSIELV